MERRQSCRLQTGHNNHVTFTAQERSLDLASSTNVNMKLKIKELFKQSQDGQAACLGNPTVYQQQQMLQQAAAIQQALLPGRSLQQLPSQPSQQLSEVRLKNLPFYTVHSSLVLPTVLGTGNQARTQEAHLQFLLSAKQATDIASNRDISPESKLEYLFQARILLGFYEMTTCARSS